MKIKLTPSVEKYLGMTRQSDKRLEYDLLMTDEERRQQEQEPEEKPKRGISINIPTLASLMNQLKQKRENGIDFDYSDDTFQNEVAKKLAMWIGMILIVCFSAFLLIQLIAYFNDKKPLDGSISELHYKRDKYIIQYDVKSGGAWWDQIPSMGYDSHYDSRKIRSYHTESYLDTCTREESHTDSEGHTTYTNEDYACIKSKQVPDYSDWWAYSINDWDRMKVITNEERLSKPERQLTAQWPKPDGLVRELGTDACGATPSVDPASQKNDPALGCQTMAADVGQWYYVSYTYKIKNEVKGIECPMDYGTWQNLRVSMSAFGEYYTHDEGVFCDDLHIGIRPTPTPEGK